MLRQCVWFISTVFGLSNWAIWKLQKSYRSTVIDLLAAYEEQPAIFPPTVAAWKCLALHLPQLSTICLIAGQWQTILAFARVPSVWSTVSEIAYLLRIVLIIIDDFAAPGAALSIVIVSAQAPCNRFSSLQCRPLIRIWLCSDTQTVSGQQRVPSLTH